MDKGAAPSFDIWEMGSYQIGNSTDDSENPDSSEVNGVLVVFTSGLYAGQLFLPHKNGVIYYRAKWSDLKYKWASINGNVLSIWLIHKIDTNLLLGELLEINKIINGFISESFSLHKGESKKIKANGILVICSQYYNLYPSIAVISPATKNIEYIGGYKEYVDGTLFTFTFENDYTTVMTSKIEGVEGSGVPFLIAYQKLLS